MAESSSDAAAKGAATQASVNGAGDSGSVQAAVPTLQMEEKPPVTRVLSAGAKGAERVAHATGVDRVVDQAVEEAIVRALRSPAVIRAIERAIERDVTSDRSRDEIAQVMRRLLASDVADQAWKEVLESEQAQK